MKDGEGRGKDGEEGDWEISVSSPNHLEVSKDPQWRANINFSWWFD